MKTRKKLFLGVLGVMAAALFLTGLLSIGAGGTSNASSVANTNKNTAKQIDAVIKSIETIKDFKFPRALGSDFTKDAAAPAVNTAPSGRDNYKAKIDDLYNLCADIIAVNDYINNLVAEIQSENTEMKALSEQLHDTKAGTYQITALKKQNADVRASLGALASDRKSVTKRVRAIPESGDSLNVTAAVRRYSDIKSKLVQRAAAMEVLQSQIQTMNETMRGAQFTSAIIAVSPSHRAQRV